MKVLSIKNPFAYWIVNGIKDIENRTWKTSYRGKLLIHVSGKPIRNADYSDFPIDLQIEIDRLMKEKIKPADAINSTEYEELKKITKLDETAFKYFNETKEFFFKTQCIIGEVDLIDIIRDSNSIFAENNQYHWILKNPILYEKPILNVKGKLSLWDLE